MKRTLIIMRHAKSSWDNAALSDHERPLNARGHKSAPIVAQQIAAEGYSPDCVISSDSTRTRETWDGMLSTFPEIDPSFLNSLYLGGLRDIADAVRTRADSMQTILALGHNPGFSMSASWLTGEQVMLKTAYAAILQNDTETWAEAMQRTDWSLVTVLKPNTVRSDESDSD